MSQGDAFIITYAIDSIQSFRSVPMFMKRLAAAKTGLDVFRNKPGSPITRGERPKDYPFPFIIAGNKVDLSDNRAVPTSEGSSLANTSGGLFYECSAKTGVGIDCRHSDLLIT